eukprot:TRINITY_DN993_c0_g1_i4.p1 TRINITY_DN993_c0_g1~~TRINITY_DN993_c0_g1_i4.p1  ORF type:complete len:274 (-),score=44.99 TRINITY_DN993_c0_g1_i4:208-1029(-)
MTSTLSSMLRFVMLASVAAFINAENRSLHDFRGLYVSGGAKVRLTVGNSSFLSVEGRNAAMLRSEVNYWGTLVLWCGGDAVMPLSPSIPFVPTFVQQGIAPCENVEVDIVALRPLSYITADFASSVITDAAAGPISASGRSSVSVHNLASPWPISINAAAAESSITIAGGKVSSVAVSVAAASKADLGSLTADHATISASDRSSVSGMTLSDGFISASSSSRVNTTAAAGPVGVSCFSSEVHVGGTAQVFIHSDWDCKVTPQKAIPYEQTILP